MNNISVGITCGYCGAEVSLNQEVTLEEDAGKFGFLNLDFSEGTITYICKFCNQCNVMHVNANQRINKGRRLPKSTGV